MSKELLVSILFGLVLSAVVVSAYNWNKRKRLRKLAIPVAVVCGITFDVVGYSNDILLVSIASLAVGIGFYFLVWIQCKNEGDRFL